MTNKPPIFIVGAPRSGNTLLRRVYMASGQIYIPPETYVVGELIRRWPKWLLLSWREKVWLFCAYFDRHKHRNDLDVESLSPFADAAIDWPREEQKLSNLLNAFYVFLAEQHGYTTERWGDKTPWNTMHLDKIVPFFKQAMYLHIIRDGRDVVASQIAADMRGVKESVDRYVSANLACEKHLKNATKVIRIHYEDLVSTPEETFRRIFEWSGIDFDPDFLNKVPKKLGDVEVLSHHAKVLQPISPSSIGKWKQKFSVHEVEGFGDSFHQQLKKYGYA